MAKAEGQGRFEATTRAALSGALYRHGPNNGTIRLQCASSSQHYDKDDPVRGKTVPRPDHRKEFSPANWQFQAGRASYFSLLIRRTGEATHNKRMSTDN